MLIIKGEVKSGVKGLAGSTRLRNRKVNLWDPSRDRIFLSSLAYRCFSYCYSVSAPLSALSSRLRDPSSVGWTMLPSARAAPNLWPIRVTPNLSSLPSGAQSCTSPHWCPVLHAGSDHCSCSSSVLLPGHPLAQEAGTQHPYSGLLHPGGDRAIG